ncbi:putative quinol monooxygenase [Williamsia sp. CHRR-6]|uniref:putative quinol monooxygenase n=1 Tax=Williamsia sp. CHRR-6 TaxID=2835871 RepID=UPI001BDA7011|nr:putative quinol monooxygenase [Williamsia sp. CHRR-6]MBT0566127.1 antibiotic biosynthesis monooxygenase [Williamsia sp. CHRR-6]
MSELHVVATIAVKPGTEAEVGAALRTLVTATQAEEGCNYYEAFESASTPGTFVTVERWRSQADLDAHMASPHVAAALGGQEANFVEVKIHPLTAL